MSLGVNLIRGSPKNESIIGLDTCSTISWSLLTGLTVICILVTWYNVKQVQYEQRLKAKFNCGLSKSCLLMEG